MVDTMTVAERSRHMALIRSKHTKPEMMLRRALHGAGLRYRLHTTGLPGKPDIVFNAVRTAIFVNGCFWHGHKCRIGHVPKSNSSFWKDKIFTNRNRDARNIRSLRNLGWKVFVVWECELSTKSKLDTKVSFLVSNLIAKKELIALARPPTLRSLSEKSSQKEM